MAVIFVDTFEKLTQIIQENLIENTLFVWDVDDTLLCAMHPAARPAAASIRNNYFEKAIKLYGVNEFIKMYASFFSLIPKRPVHPKLPSFLIYLKANNNLIYHIALTAMDTEQLGELSCQVTFRLNELKNNGYFFDSKISTKQEPSYFFDLYNGRTPPYHREGVIFGAYHNKGEVLQHALNRFNVKVKKLIIIDDFHQNLNHLETVFKKSELEVLCIHYQDQTIFCEKICTHTIHIQFEQWLYQKRWSLQF